MSTYNYENFPLDMDMHDFHAFPGVLEVGQRAPSGEVLDARSGEPVRMSRYWRSGPCVIEFGSIT